MLDLLFLGGTIVTADKDSNILTDGMIGVSKGEIALISEIPKNSADIPDAEEIITLDSEIVMPGLINTHCHAADSLFRGLVENLSLEEWLQDVWKAEKTILTPETTRLGSYLGLAENLLAGVTTVLDMFWYPFETAEASMDLGMRLCTGGIFIDFPGVGNRTQEQYLIEASDFCAKFQKSSFIFPGVMPHGTYTVKPEHLKDAKKIADNYQAIFSTHAAETRFEQSDISDRYGRSVIRHLDRLNILDNRAILAHCVHLDDYEKDLIKERRSIVAHNPMSNLKLGSGIAPVQSLLERHVNVTIGTDGAISGNDLDMWLSMRLAATLPKGALMKPDIVSAKEVIEMVTLNGARALGRANDLGSLEVGKKADIIVVSTNAIHAAPLFDPLTHLVYSAAKSDVKHVFIDGVQCVKNGSILTVNMEDILLEVRKLKNPILESLKQ